MEQRYIEFRVKQDGNKIIGLASPVYDGTPGTEYKLYQNCYERFSSGAFDKYLSKNPKVICQVNHDKNMRLGKTPDNLRVWTDKRGLHYECEPTDTSYARDLRTNITAGLIEGSSFTFKPTDVEWKTEAGKDIRLIKEAEVYEVAPVFEAAYGSSSVGIRSLPDEERSNLEKEKADYIRRIETEKRLAKLDTISSQVNGIRRK